MKEKCEREHISQEKEKKNRHKLQRFEVSTPIFILNAHNLTSSRFLQSMNVRSEMNIECDTIRNCQSYFHFSSFFPPEKRKCACDADMRNGKFETQKKAPGVRMCLVCVACMCHGGL